jgi:hypothetical protein
MFSPADWIVNAAFAALALPLATTKFTCGNAAIWIGDTIDSNPCAAAACVPHQALYHRRPATPPQPRGNGTRHGIPTYTGDSSPRLGSSPVSALGVGSLTNGPSTLSKPTTSSSATCLTARNADTVDERHPPRHHPALPKLSSRVSQAGANPTLTSVSP